MVDHIPSVRSPFIVVISVWLVLLTIRDLQSSSFTIKSLVEVTKQSVPQTAINNTALHAAVDSVDSGSVESIVKQCKPKSEEDIQGLQKEIKSYEKSRKFNTKIQEVMGKAPLSSQRKQIMNYLKEHCLRKGWSVLELGAAAGLMLRLTIDAYNTEENLKGPRGKFQGVELVPGWVEWASKYFSDKEKWGDVSFTNGDVTDFDLGHNHTFDFVMLHDVMEHLQRDRYGCFFQQIQKITHEASVIYMHTPTPEAQIGDTVQYYENVLPHHILISGMAMAGFQLVTMEHDTTSKCPGGGKHKHLPKALEDSKCYYKGW
eukprot:CAMPEP_0113619546 /NCGR_PEP_ID=MMETSP0017_2-20120614/9926_1 /TAXON_ID=2856 /ORGANISM="Cylindrotheca closterium" /LENGTH=315 /DNA_ID=CAMNT_0000529125 /DNA_START=40 /DNA_END=984 /DNA_ORIENTATION=+ /assembly_acc=CAM_ASM_000147